MTPLITQSVARVQAWLSKNEARRIEIAKQADIDEKTLRLARQPDWDPRASTLRKLETLIPARRKREAA